MVTKRATATVATHYRLLADFQSIIETLLRCVAQVDHDSQTVHFADYLLSELAHAVVRITTLCRVADVIIAVMTERHIDDAALGKVLQVLQLPIQRQTILDAQHDALPTLALVRI